MLPLAETYITEARKKANAWFFSDKNGAAELLEKAANIIEASGDYNRAGMLFAEAAGYSAYPRGRLDVQALKAYINAKNVTKATELFEPVIAYEIERGMIVCASELMSSLAEIHPPGSAEAITLLRRAVNIGKTRFPSLTINALERLGQMTNDPEIFEELADMRLKDTLLRWNASTDFRRAFLCRVLRDGVATAMKKIPEYVSKYPNVDTNPQFAKVVDLVNASSAQDFDARLTLTGTEIVEWEWSLIQILKALLFP